jgi:hypothetical protein
MEQAGIGWIAAIIIGGIAGWLAEQFMKSNMGVLMNIILGIVGAMVANASANVKGARMATAPGCRDGPHLPGRASDRAISMVSSREAVGSSLFQATPSPI